nr:CheR family methyltransferase [Tahibacter harae]
MLISVTNFFRDPEAFEALRRDVIPQLMEGVPGGEEVRVWIPGCASGEESYSVAILLQEYADSMRQPPRVQVFASDINDAALNYARTGIYPSNIATDISDTRLLGYFEKEQSDHFRVRSAIREMIVFARHNVLTDPPFSRLDLICCRNLLIYLDRTAQSIALEMFSFALKPGGYLFLGNAESIDSSAQAFQTVSKEHRIYRLRPDASSVIRSRIPSQLVSSAGMPLPTQAPATSRGFEPMSVHQTLSMLHERALVNAAPPSVLINAEYEIERVSPGAGRFVAFGEGVPTRNLLSNVAPDIRVELRAALYRAAESCRPVRSLFVRKDETADQRGSVLSLAVHPVPSEDGAAGYWLVIFDEPPDSTLPLLPADEADGDSYQLAMRRMEEENRSLKAHLQDTLDRSAISNEELKASNEELQAINEELRSAKEELETSKEELQSVNEELTTVNYELRLKVDEAGRNNDDLRNLIEASEIATVFVDQAMRVKRFTPQASKLFALIASDIGRPLLDVKSRLKYDEMVEDASAVFNQLRPVERAISSIDDEHFFARILPYRTSQDKIGGAVLTFVNVTELRRAESRVKAAEDRLRDAIASNKDFAVISTDINGKVTSWNDGAKRMYGYEFDEIIGRPIDLIYTAIDRAAGVPEQERRLAAQLGRASDERWHVRKDQSTVYCSGVVTPLHGNSRMGFVKIALDISQRKLAELKLGSELHDEQLANARLKAASDLKDRFLAVVSHELKQPLNLIQVHAELLLRLPETAHIPQAQRIGQSIRRAVVGQGKIVNDLLELSRADRQAVPGIRAHRPGRAGRAPGPGHCAGGGAERHPRDARAGAGPVLQLRSGAHGAGGVEPARQCGEIHAAAGTHRHQPVGARRPGPVAGQRYGHRHSARVAGFDLRSFQPGPSGRRKRRRTRCRPGHRPGAGARPGRCPRRARTGHIAGQGQGRHLHRLAAAGGDRGGGAGAPGAAFRLCRQAGAGGRRRCGKRHGAGDHPDHGGRHGEDGLQRGPGAAAAGKRALRPAVVGHRHAGHVRHRADQPGAPAQAAGAAARHRHDRLRRQCGYPPRAGGGLRRPPDQAGLAGGPVRGGGRALSAASFSFCVAPRRFPPAAEAVPAGCIVQVVKKSGRFFRTSPWPRSGAGRIAAPDAETAPSMRWHGCCSILPAARCCVCAADPAGAGPPDGDMAGSARRDAAGTVRAAVPRAGPVRAAGVRIRQRPRQPRAGPPPFVRGRPMLLRTFILRHGEEQLSPAWTDFGGSIAAPAPADLRGGVLALLDAIAAAMRRGNGRLRPQSGAAGSVPAARLGLDAYAAGLSAAALLDGLRALRGGLARRWLRDAAPAAPASAELLDFYEAFDAAAAAALNAFLGAQERDRALALGVVAHDLRGKLQSTLMSNYLMERVQDAAVGRELLGQQKKTLEHLGRLAGDLAALGLRSGLDCRPEPVELNDLATQTMQEVAMEFPGRRFVLRSCGSLPGSWDRAHRPGAAEPAASCGPAWPCAEHGGIDPGPRRPLRVADHPQRRSAAAARQRGGSAGSAVRRHRGTAAARAGPVHRTGDRPAPPGKAQCERGRRRWHTLFPAAAAGAGLSPARAAGSALAQCGDQFLHRLAARQGGVQEAGQLGIAAAPVQGLDHVQLHAEAVGLVGERVQAVAVQRRAGGSRQGLVQCAQLAQPLGLLQQIRLQLLQLRRRRDDFDAAHDGSAVDTHAAALQRSVRIAPALRLHRMQRRDFAARECTAGRGHQHAHQARRGALRTERRAAAAERRQREAAGRDEGVDLAGGKLGRLAAHRTSSQREPGTGQALRRRRAAGRARTILQTCAGFFPLRAGVACLRGTALRRGRPYGAVCRPEYECKTTRTLNAASFMIGRISAMEQTHGTPDFAGRR